MKAGLAAGEDSKIRALEAKVSGSVDTSGVCAGFAASEEVLANGLLEAEKGFEDAPEPDENGFAFVLADGPVPPNN